MDLGPALEINTYMCLNLREFFMDISYVLVPDMVTFLRHPTVVSNENSFCFVLNIINTFHYNRIKNR